MQHILHWTIFHNFSSNRMNFVLLLLSSGFEMLAWAVQHRKNVNSGSSGFSQFFQNLLRTIEKKQIEYGQNPDDGPLNQLTPVECDLSQYTALHACIIEFILVWTGWYRDQGSYDWKKAMKRSPRWSGFPAKPITQDEFRSYHQKLWHNSLVHITGIQEMISSRADTVYNLGEHEQHNHRALIHSIKFDGTTQPR
jgi:hypothetical protein